MRLTKFGHACVRLEYDDRVVVIDPGVFTAPEAIDGATHVLITHEHPDHVHPDHLRRPEAVGAVIHTIAAVHEQLPADLRERVSLVAPGDHIGELDVEVVGEKHAVIHEDLPHFDNSGFLFTVAGARIFHPGDALTVPDEPIDLLLLPISAPWMKVAECIDYARAVAARRNVGIHEKVYSDAGLGIVEAHVARFLPQGSDYRHIADGSDFTL